MFADVLDAAFVRVHGLGLRLAQINLSEPHFAEFASCFEHGSPYVEADADSVRYRGIPVVRADLSIIDCYGDALPQPLIEDDRKPIITAPTDGSWFNAIGPGWDLAQEPL